MSLQGRAMTRCVTAAAVWSHLCFKPCPGASPRDSRHGKAAPANPSQRASHVRTNEQTATVVKGYWKIWAQAATLSAAFCNPQLHQTIYSAKRTATPEFHSNADVVQEHTNTRLHLSFTWQRVQWKYLKLCHPSSSELACHLQSLSEEAG